MCCRKWFGRQQNIVSQMTTEYHRMSRPGGLFGVEHIYVGMNMLCALYYAPCVGTVCVRYVVVLTMTGQGKGSIPGKGAISQVIATPSDGGYVCLRLSAWRCTVFFTQGLDNCSAAKSSSVNCGSICCENVL